MVLDTIVIGAGAMGSAAAYWLSKFQDTALIEQNDLLHTQGSSHGQSRVIRKTYTEHYFTEMMEHAYPLWSKIQKETNTSVMTNTGGIDLGREGNDDLKRTLNICETQDLEFEVLDASQIQSRFPAYNVDDDYYAIYQEDTGILNATKAVDMFQQQAVRQGTQIMSNTAVLEIQETGELFSVKTTNGSYQAKQIVIAAGSWINTLLSKLDLQVQVQIWKLTFAYWKVRESALFKPENFPVFIHWADTADYGFPMHERQGYVKIAPHLNPIIPKTDIKDNDNPVNDDLLEHTADFIQSTFQGLFHEPYFPETCLYTMTNTEDFILDYLPGNDNIVVAGGFSGHGFKFTPLIGKIIQQMVMQEEIDFDMSNFKINRFLV